ncbi:site-specific DNA-methyltransferase [Ligilactobacillus sp. 110_WCHN]|uniref:site-specific DNA-methyltransferase n=1 Tax=Ligilactobacillus sp. 110_WCHN TaxID=3057125 RepID=UPI0026718608|nr:site-specific DNA-methyltransferase [Ligilactobacillus sp. 110_WCHN]MDO3392415.1 DNA methyltransferase [Ligilactobacillus sp. 110_WCHN]
MIRDHLQSNENVKPNTAFLEELKNKLPEFFNDEGFDIEKFQNALKENDVNEFSEGYQLNFIGKDYARKQAGDAPTSVIVPDNEHNQKEENKNSKNLFFTGDNLEVLRHLRNNYSNKIDVIYIDPPYNTGNDDFVYPDKFEYSDKQLEEVFGMSEKDILKLNALKGSKSHSAWLTFMYPRLWLAKQLLTDDGVIFVSIDENEEANLNLVLNDIFGEMNYVGDMIRKTRTSNSDSGNGFNQQHEYIKIFSKKALSLRGDRKDFSNYKNPDNDKNGEWIKDNPSARSGGSSMAFEIKNPYTGQIDFPPEGRYWAFSYDTFNKWIKEGKVIWEKDIKKGRRGFFVKKYKKELKDEYKTFESLTFISSNYLNSVGTKEVRDNYFNGQSLFSSPKPVNFIKKLIKSFPSKEFNVLDFFAGSATTADAVMQLNAEDGGKRKFIMVQLPEKTYEVDKNGNKRPTKGGKAAFDAGYMSIDEISRERIKRAAKKIKDENPDLDENFDGGFKHYCVVSPQKETLDKIYDFDPERYELVSDMIDSFSSSALGVPGNASGEDTILTTWLAEDGYDFNTDDLVEYNFAGYKAYGIKDTRLYLIDGNLNSKQIKELLNQLGTNKMKFQSIVVYGYSFNVMDIKELERGLSQLNSKVNLIKRY